MQILITTLVNRPYVFGFLISFLIIGILNRGLARTLLFLALGFSIAFLSEVSSIRNGFPYGMYHYVYENLQGELLWLGVPLWDSVSYSFLAYAAYEYGLYFKKTNLAILSLLMVLLDVATDPLAVMGDRWFLGRIFYYPNGGPYFGVPLSNFAGWFLVAFTIFASFRFLEKRMIHTPSPLKYPLLGPLFYWGILAFNLLITFWIGEWVLGAVGLAIHFTLAGWLIFSLRRQKSVF